MKNRASRNQETEVPKERKQDTRRTEMKYQQNSLSEKLRFGLGISAGILLLVLGVSFFAGLNKKGEKMALNAPLPQMKPTPTPFPIDFDKLVSSGFAKLSDSEYSFQNKDKNFQVSISQETDKDLSVKVEKNGKVLALSLLPPSSSQESNTRKSLNFPIFNLLFQKAYASSALSDKKVTLEANSSNDKELIVKNLLPNVELKYNISNTKLKEEIVLKDRQTPSKYTFNLELDGLTFRRQADGLWYFYDKEDKNFEKPLFYIPKPFMVDAKGERSEAVEIEISEEAGLITLTADSNWLSDPTRTYPVTIDPTIELVILNVHSSPQAGDNWEVSFETKGQADLTISPVDQATIDNLDFISLKCLSRAESRDGNEERTPEIKEGDVIFYPNWSCEEEGKVVHHVNVAGKHTLKFQFGEEIGYAYNAAANGEICVADGDCTSGNCSCDYSSFDCYCTPSGNCAHRSLVYSNDFSSDPGITSLGSHAYKIVDFTSTTTYELRYKWTLDSYSSGTFGFAWVAEMCNTTACSIPSANWATQAVYAPDTDYGSGYQVKGEGVDSTSWYIPSTQTNYVLRFTKDGSSGTFKVYDGASKVFEATFTARTLATINRFAIAAWDQTYMSEDIHWRSTEKDVYSYILRSNGYYDTSLFDDLAIYSDTSCGSGCYGYTNGSTSDGNTCMNGTWSYFKTRFEGVKMEGVKID